MPFGFIGLKSVESDFGIKKLGDESFYSQYRQDMFLRFFLFPQKNDGIFIDIGGNHPVTINNTYYFEQIGWTGLAFEPVKKNNALWGKTRKTECLPIALGNKETEMEFVEYEDDVMSGFKNSVDYKGSVKDTYMVKVRPLKSVLLERNIQHVDFMSIDVEGGEMDVLEGIDFETLDIYCILIENNKGSKKAKKVRQYLIGKGYFLFGRLWLDDVWIKRSDRVFEI
ncbi:MAG: FkbM family methyltransferase [Lachnospiraceae bacterium]|nr:FkbM family methyltransferase [Lachnospiraceae bacterium]